MHVAGAPVRLDNRQTQQSQKVSDNVKYTLNTLPNHGRLPASANPPGTFSEPRHDR